jgi:hypothetical protein
MAQLTLYLLIILNSVENKSVENSCYGLDVMKNSHSKESICCFMYGIVHP